MYTKAKGEIARVASIFHRKRELERFLAAEILIFEDETGLRVDSIHYQRNITLPVRGSLYTDLSIIITEDDVPTKTNRKSLTQEQIDNDMKERNINASS